MGIRDDLIRAMKKKEVTLMVLADFSKAFHTVCFKSIIIKMHSLGFSRNFLTWLTNYLSDRHHYVQIDDRKSSPALLEFGIPQGSILGPMLFNMYVADLQDNLPLPITSFQYADDTTMYTSCTASSITSQAEALNSSLASLSTWSKDSNLALNAKETKAMLISTSQMARAHSLRERDLGLTISGKALERVRTTKVLGVHLSEHLEWDDHISQLSKSCYAVLRTIRKLKNFADFKLRQHLVETLILSKLDYSDTVFYPLPQFLVQRLQRVQFAAASFVTGKYVSDISVIRKLRWLPVKVLAPAKFAIFERTRKMFTICAFGRILAVICINTCIFSQDFTQKE